MVRAELVAAVCLYDVSNTMRGVGIDLLLCSWWCAGGLLWSLLRVVAAPFNRVMGMDKKNGDSM